MNLFLLLQIITKVFVYSYSGLILIYFILRLIFWDKFWLIALIGNFIPLILFPILILPLPAFLIIKKRWFLIVSSIACLLLIGWLHTQYFSPQTISAANTQPLKIFSLNNSWHKTETETLVEIIKREKPDIVFLQEITRNHITKSFPKLKAEYPYQTSDDIKGYRAAILSRYPIEFQENLHLAGHSEVQQRAIIKIKEKLIVVYNIQTISPWIRLRKILPFLTIPVYEFDERSLEIQDLIERLKKESLPVIVAGDFNMSEQSEDYYYLRQVLNDSFRVSGMGFGLTWPAGWRLDFLIPNSTWKLNYPLLRIDYIWYSNHWVSKSAEVLSTTGSDHLPLVAELVLSK
ncbi:endonuclease/exonuclease/phosphatase family protein [Okeania sp. SIO2B3]|uniref:endonuclease/exonuclease/phosphatase family protein n=1 Tax=Okeania sp. SIO2B3 TaxID=2607784 RepID=UPI0013BFE396|nr:endonuclease/exonuclease/phosphatase family protein [Okeania sp. SIO2B3]NET40715.1 endonuclease/exonuclease/phosphatase [Okeania sp. SIO2B3]